MVKGHRTSAAIRHVPLHRIGISRTQFSAGLYFYGTVMCKRDGNSAVTPVRRLTVGSVAIQKALGGGQQVSSISYSYLVNEGVCPLLKIWE